MSRPDNFARARADFNALATADPYQAARLLVERWPHHPPDFFYDSGGKRRDFVLEALGGGEGWVCRFLWPVPDPYRYNLHAEHLGLPPECAEAALLLCPRNVRWWVRALRAKLKGPLYWCLEVGENGRVHVHVLAAGDAGLLHLPRGGEVVKRVYNLPGLLEYLGKPAMPYTAGNVALWLIAKRRGRLPKLSGTVRVPNRRTWHPSASVRTFNSVPVAAAAAAAFFETGGLVGRPAGRQEGRDFLTARAAAAAPEVSSSLKAPPNVRADLDPRLIRRVQARRRRERLGLKPYKPRPMSEWLRARVQLKQ